jgi:hypothetical protein
MPDPFKSLMVCDVAGTNAQPLGIKYYEPQRKYNPGDTVTGFSPSRSKNIGCFKIEQPVMGWTSTPAAKYIGPENWEKKTGKWSSSPKHTFTEDVFKREKDKPGPQKYDTSNFKLNRLTGLPKQ